jgi:hypothetical protein
MTDKSFQPVVLRPDDVVVFLTMPGAPNQPLLDVLRQHIQPIPAVELNGLSAPTSRELQLACVTTYGEWRDKIAAAPLCVTLLCDPVERTLASYREDQQTGTFKEGFGLEGYLSETRFEDRVDNVQVRRLVGSLAQSMTPEARLFLAREHLEQCAVFGLAEQFQESVLLLSYSFGWPVENGLKSLTLDPAREVQLDQLSPQVRDLLIQRNHLDIALYETACSTFEQSLTQLVTTLLDGKDALHEVAGARPLPGLEAHAALRVILMLREMRLRLFPPGSRLENGYRWLRGKALR